ncbi:MAG: hypothetical protein K2X11_10005, partial [Acetobacteraceae bacterium]|nr:hypothetical protein [Acetobacteraceae bacterium]
MRHLPPIAAGLLAALSASPVAQGQSAAGANIAEDIGSWRLGCVVDRMTDRPTCELRHKDWVERPSGSPGLALEILWRDGRALPAVTARNLSLDGAMRGVLALTGSAQIRFDTNPMAEMPCALEGRSLICAPRAADAARLSEELSRARRVLIRMAGMGASGSEPAELPLTDSRAAAER